MAGELTRRWAVALVGIPAVIGLLYLGGWPLAVAVAVVAGVGARELQRLAEARGGAPLAALGVLGAAALVLLAGWSGGYTVFAPAALALLGALTVVALIGATFWRGPEGGPLGATAVTLLGPLYVGLALACVPLMQALPEGLGWGGGRPGPWLGVLAVAMPLAATWLGDAVAFFAGRAWGKHRLAPSVSPKKSWEGAVAGVLGAAAGAAIWSVIAAPALPAGSPLASPFVAAAAGALLGVGAILGDLAESVLKREAGVKDSGTVFPGHGGVLDRLDALIFTLPMAYTILMTLGGDR